MPDLLRKPAPTGRQGTGRPVAVTVQSNVKVAVLAALVDGRAPRVMPGDNRAPTVSGPLGQAEGDAVLEQVTALDAGQFSPTPGLSVTTAPVTVTPAWLVTTKV